MTAGQRAFSEERAGRIAPAMQAHIEAENFCGIEWRIARDNRVLHAGRVGRRDTESGLPVPEGAIYRIYSMTKPVISALLLMLWEEGRFRLYDPLTRFMPHFGDRQVLIRDADGTERLEPARRPINIADLLTHTSGLSYDFLYDCPVAERYAEAVIIGDGSSTLEALVRRIAEFPLARHPGSAYHYSVSVDVAAHLAQVIADRPLGELLEERLFAPLGMADTAFHVPEAKRERIMGMYGTPFLGTPFPPAEPPRQELTPLAVDDEHPADKPGIYERGGHGLFSTTEDFGRFSDMLVTGRAADGRPLLAGPTLDLFAANRLADKHLPMVINRIPMPGYGFGLGVRVRTDPGRTFTPGRLGEFGWSGAASTNFWVDPAENITGVFMTQYQGPSGTVEPVTDEFRTLAYATLV